jgi:WD40 repeat protein
MLLNSGEIYMNPFLSIRILSVALLFCAAHAQVAQTKLPEINQTASGYEDWIKPYKLASTRYRFSANGTQPKLIISVVIEREPDANEKHSFLLGNEKSISGLEISGEGKVAYFSQSPLDPKGSCCSQIDKDELERIGQLLANLPDDHSRLPPNGRRLVLQIPSGDKYDVRVYDLANAPNTVLELLRLTKSGIRSHVLWFTPETEWKASDSVYGLAVISDEQQIISSGLNGPIKIWDADSHILIREAGKPQDVPFTGLILSPDDSTAVIEGWGVIGLIDTRTWQSSRVIEEPFIERKRDQLSNPQFIKNGRFLLLESDEPALHIYDTKTRKRRSTLPEIPANAIAYYPSPSWNHAVYQSADNQIIFLDVTSQQNIALLDRAKIKYVAFSHDESQVAVVTFHPGQGNEFPRDRIRIWNADNGKFVKELFPFERDFCESVEGIMWSPDGKYILVANKADIFFTSRGISIWNVETSRHRGELSGCPTKLNGLGFLRGKTKVVAGCGDGIIRIWDLANALIKIGEFEKTFIEK